MQQLASQSATPRLSEIDDRILIGRAAGGDDVAFSELVRRYYPRAVRVAFGLVHSREDAEDVVQDAFVKAHRCLESFRAASGFYTWFYRIVVNLSIDYLRRRKRERRVDVEDECGRDALSRGETLWPTHERTDPFSNVQNQRLRQRLEAGFAQLPDIHRAVLTLREIDGLSYEEISKSLGIKKGTVMSRLFHARRAMQQYLVENEEDRGFSLANLFGDMALPQAA